MPTYVTLYNWTQEGIKSVKQSPERLDAAKEAVEAECIETAPWETIEVRAIFCWKDSRRRDTDNATGSLKAAYDGIVDSGLVIDDDYKHMNRLPPMFHIDRIHPRVELIITRIE